MSWLTLLDISPNGKVKGKNMKAWENTIKEKIDEEKCKIN